MNLILVTFWILIPLVMGAYTTSYEQKKLREIEDRTKGG